MTAPDIEALRAKFNEAFLARSRDGDDPLVSECHDAGLRAVAEAAYVAGGQGPYKEARVARVAAEAEAKRLRHVLSFVERKLLYAKGECANAGPIGRIHGALVRALTAIENAATGAKLEALPGSEKVGEP